MSSCNEIFETARKIIANVKESIECWFSEKEKHLRAKNNLQKKEEVMDGDDLLGL